MLTKTQIQRIAQRHGVGMQVQERDYLQHLILWLLYSSSQELIFKGGTALRLVYGGNRYSEDLDFNGPDDVATLQSLWEKAVAGLHFLVSPAYLCYNTKTPALVARPEVYATPRVAPGRYGAALAGIE
jgi:predicted nucleotidyltransferase component of viral defense system